MAHIYKPTVVKPIPAGATVRTIGDARCACWTNRRGKKIEAELTADGKKCRVPSPTWWIEYTGAGGTRERVKGYPSREATAHLATDLERRANDVRAGHVAPQRDAPAHLSDHLPAFREWLESRGTGSAHVETVVRNVRSVLTGLSVTTPGSVDCETVLRWLAHERKRLSWTAANQNRYAQFLRQFGRWLVSTGRTRFNVFERVAPTKTHGEKSRNRRRLSDDELARLIEAARASARSLWTLDGQHRARLYLLAAYTGLRIGALAQLKPTNFSWDDSAPVSVTASGRQQKNRKPNTIPLHHTVAEELADWLAGLSASAPIFPPGNWSRRGAKLVAHDLSAARAAWIAEAKSEKERARREGTDTLAVMSAAEEVFDFHALRVQFVSSLALAGVPLTAAQQLAGHSTPALTANIYTRWGPAETAAEVAKLPGLKVRRARAG